MRNRYNKILETRDYFQIININIVFLLNFFFERIVFLLNNLLFYI